MLSFKRPPNPERTGGAKLPMPFGGLDKLGVSFRRSEVVLIAGTPGAGKSTFAHIIAVKSEVPTLYIAADTSEWTMRVRTLATLSGLTQAEAEAGMLDTPDPEWWSGIDHIAWSFEAGPTVDYIALEAEAYAEVFGEYPEMIVVDNLIDAAEEDGGDEWGALRKTMKRLKRLARHTDSCVVVLHHVSEANSFNGAPARAAIQGKVAQLPALVITIGNLDGEHLHLGVVKYRYGRAADNGSYGCVMEFDGARMQLRDKVSRF